MRTMRELGLLLLFASFFIISTAELDPERFTFNPSDCSPDEEFLRCGAVCHPTCESIFKPEETLVCTKQCIIGCFCRRGLLRDKNGRCIPREACRKPEHLSQEKIDETGEDRFRPDRQPDGRPLFSSPIKPERPSFSPTTCRADEEYKHCGSVCDDTCSTVFATELRPCTLQCVSGCFCKPPLVRDLGDVCVPANQCSNVTSAYAPQGSPDSFTEGRGGRKFPPQSSDGRDGRRPDSRYPKQYPQQPDVKDGGRYPSGPSGSDGIFGQRFRPQPDGRDGRYPSQQPDVKDGGQFRPQPGSRDGRDGRGFPPQSPGGKDNRFRPQPAGRDGRYPSQPDTRDGRYPSQPDTRDGRYPSQPDTRDGRYPSQPDTRDGRYPSQPDTRDGRYPSQPDTRDGRQYPRRPEGRDARQYPSQQPEGRDGRSSPDSVSYIKPERGVTNPRDCRRDENYQTCGSACDDTCVNIYDRGSRACTYQCVIGCYCNKPLVRAADGSCVRPENCATQNTTSREGRSGQQPQYPTRPQYPQYPQYPQQPQSPQNPQYPQRPQYPQYPQYPQNPQQSPQYPTQTKEPFPKQPGGNFSAPSGPYPPQQSPFDTQCGPNEVFLTCGTSCEDTCETIFDTRPRACTYQCVMGCFCNQGLVRDRNGNCVAKNQCPTPPQYAAKGGSSLPRDAIIHSPSISVSPNSANRANTAIESGRRTQSANECREDEVFNQCGSRCADNCQNVFEDGPKFCTYECVIGCFCRPPLVRSADGGCIAREQCPALLRRPRSYFQAASNPLPAALRQAPPQTGCRNEGFETSTQK